MVEIVRRDEGEVWNGWGEIPQVEVVRSDGDESWSARAQRLREI